MTGPGAAPEADAIAACLEIVAALRGPDGHPYQVRYHAEEQLIALRARLEAAEADTKRLDWLDQEDNVGVGRVWMATVQTDYEGEHGEIELFCLVSDNAKEVHAETIRAVIDAARAGAPTPEAP